MNTVRHTCPDCGHDWVGQPGDPTCLACQYDLTPDGEWVPAGLPACATNDDQPRAEA